MRIVTEKDLMLFSSYSYGGLSFICLQQSSVEVVGSPVNLYGHTSRINCLCVCRPYSIMVSASEDGTCIIWDLNRLVVEIKRYPGGQEEKTDTCCSITTCHTIISGSIFWPPT